MGFSNAFHFRRIVAGWCMIVGPLLALAAFVVAPAIESGSAAQVAEVAANQDRFLISTLLAMAAVAMVVGAALGMIHMLRERMVAFGHIGGGLALLGLLALMAQLGAQLMLWPMVRNGVQPADVVAWNGLTNDAATVIPLFILPWATVIGFAGLAIGLYRAHAVDWWMSAMLFLGALGITLAGPLASVAVGIIGSALFLSGSGAIGLMVLRESDADWEHTPEYQGFRPAHGMS